MLMSFAKFIKGMSEFREQFVLNKSNTQKPVKVGTKKGDMLAKEALHKRNTIIGMGTEIGFNLFLGKNISIGKNSIIEDFVSIGDNVIIKDNVFIGRGNKILKGSILRKGSYFPFKNLTLPEGTIYSTKEIRAKEIQNSLGLIGSLNRDYGIPLAEINDLIIRMLLGKKFKPIKFTLEFIIFIEGSSITKELKGFINGKSGRLEDRITGLGFDIDRILIKSLETSRFKILSQKKSMNNDSYEKYFNTLEDGIRRIS